MCVCVCVYMYICTNALCCNHISTKHKLHIKSLIKALEPERYGKCMCCRATRALLEHGHS